MVRKQVTTKRLIKQLHIQFRITQQELSKLIIIITFGILTCLLFLNPSQAQQVVNEIAKLSPLDAEDNDNFGNSVAVDGNFALIGAVRDDNNQGNGAGSAYVFERKPDGTWIQTDMLTSPNTDSFVEFGFSVDLSGNYAVIGAPQAETGIFDNETGEAYIFEVQEDGSWDLVSELIGNDTDSGHEFGCSVSVSGSFILIGACGDDQNGNFAGSAYIFGRQNDGTWIQQAKLLPDDGAAADYFAVSVSLSNGRALIGASHNDDNGDASGAAYIFEQQDDGSWMQTSKLLSNDGQSLDLFGYSVALTTNLALIGAVNDDNGLDLGYRGSAYVFELQNNGTWSETAKLNTSAEENMGLIFGNAVALSENVALIGAYDDNGVTPGSAYGFERQPDGTWEETSTLLAADGVRGDLFGISVALSENFFVIGASYDDDNGNNAGLAYVFDRNVSTSSELSNVVPSALELEGNYPNPFNPKTTIRYSLPATQEVTISVYDLLGRRVAILVNGELQSSGSHEIVFEANGLSSGIYLYRLQSDGEIRTERMVLMK